MALPAVLVALDRPYVADLTIVQGDGHAVQCQIAYNNDAPVDLTGCSFTAQVYDKAGGTKICDLTVTPVDLTQGELQVGYLAADSAAIAPPSGQTSSRDVQVGIWYLRASTAGSDPATIVIGNCTLVRPR